MAEGRAGEEWAWARWREVAGRCLEADRRFLRVHARLCAVDRSRLGEGQRARFERALRRSLQVVQALDQVYALLRDKGLLQDGESPVDGLAP
jgi:hypothetical protein